MHTARYIFCFSVLEWWHLLFLPRLLQTCSLPSSLFAFLVCPCWQRSGRCVQVHKQERKRKSCETSEFLWLQPSFLSSSLCVAPRRQFWIWHLNKYESALFFFFPSFCLRIHTLLTGSRGEVFSLSSSLLHSTLKPVDEKSAMVSLTLFN